MSDQETLEFTVDLAQQAGAVLMEWWGKELTHTIKTGETDYATEADLAAEQLVLSAIQERFPEDRIIAEESGVHGPEDAAHVWTIDPLDGTFNFANGIPQFGTMIARMRGEQVVTAVIYNPHTQELATASNESTPTYNGQPVQFDRDQGVDGHDGIVSRYFKSEQDRERLDLLSGALDKRDSQTHSFGSAAQNLLELFAQRRHYMVFSAGYEWDVAPVVGLCRMAGWVYVDEHGKAASWRDEYGIRMVASPAAATQLQEMLNGIQL